MSFVTNVHGLVKRIPRGRISTYKDIAHALGTGAYRGVGQAMRKSPGMPEVPCHRVVASDGSLGGFFGETDGEPIQRKIAMLRKEGIFIKNGKIADFEKKRYTFV